MPRNISVRNRICALLSSTARNAEVRGGTLTRHAPRVSHAPPATSRSGADCEFSLVRSCGAPAERRREPPVRNSARRDKRTCARRARGVQAAGARRAHPPRKAGARRPQHPARQPPGGWRQRVFNCTPVHFRRQAASPPRLWADKRAALTRGGCCAAPRPRRTRPVGSAEASRCEDGEHHHASSQQARVRHHTRSPWRIG